MAQQIFEKVSPEAVRLAEEQSVLCHSSETHQYSYTFVGHKESVRELEVKLNILIGSREEEIAKENTPKKDSFRGIDALQQEFFKLTNFYQKMKEKYSLLSFSGDVKNTQLTIEGLPKDICAVQEEMHDFLDKFKQSKYCVTREEGFIKVLRTESADEAIKSELKVKGIVALWNIGEKNITLHSESKSISEAAMKCVDHFIWKLTYPADRDLDEQEKVLLESDLWPKRKQEIKQRYQPLHFYELERQERVIVHGLEQVRNNLIEDISRFFRENTERSVDFKGAPNRVRFLNELKIQTVVNLQQVHQVRILAIEQSKGFRITGSIDNITNCRRELEKEHDSIRRDLQVVSNPAIIQHINEDDRFLELTGRRSGCLVIPYNGEDDSTVASVKLQKIEVKLECGSICEVQKVDITTMVVDAIVNPANEDLLHGGGLAKAIVKIGMILDLNIMHYLLCLMFLEIY